MEPTFTDEDSYKLTPMSSFPQRKRRGVIIFNDILETLHKIDAPTRADGSVKLGHECTQRLGVLAGLRDDEFARGCQLHLLTDTVRLYIEDGWLPDIAPGCAAPVVHTVRHGA